MIIKNANIVLEDEILKGYSLKILKNKIVEISKNIDETNEEVIDAKNKNLLPGFIDCHIHGGYGVDFETGGKNRFELFASNIVKEGITSYVQAAVTNSWENNKKYFLEFNNFISKKNSDGAKCLGVHSEGPFISIEKKGAHDENLIESPTLQSIKKFIKISKNNLKILTYAAELQNGDVTKYLISKGIIPSYGHSNMKYEQFENEYNLGLRHITHLFNGMTTVDHYHPGLAVAGLNYNGVLVELITDGIHLHPAIIDLVYKTKSIDEICLITDSINAKGLPNGDYKIGNLNVYKKGIEIRLKENNALAGSGATYIHNVKIFHKVTNANLIEISKVSATNIAKQLGVYNETGSIKIGKLADLVLIDNDFNIYNTIVNGKVLFSK